MISDLALSCSAGWWSAYCCPSGSRLAASTAVRRTADENATASSEKVRIPLSWDDIMVGMAIEVEETLATCFYDLLVSAKCLCAT
jgi:hypothetical protein